MKQCLEFSFARRPVSVQERNLYSIPLADEKTTVSFSQAVEMHG